MYLPVYISAMMELGIGIAILVYRGINEVRASASERENLY